MAASRLDGLAVAMLEGIAKRLWGFRPRLMPVIVENLGAARALGWFACNMPRYEWTRRTFGPFRTHLLTTAVSLVNGCRYCTFGHAYALQLTYLRDRDDLFPLDEHTITALLRLSTADIRDRLVNAAQSAGLGSEVPWIDRTFALAVGTQQPVDRDDSRLAHLVRMFGVLNACAIAGDVVPDEAHDPANRDRALKDSYARRRAATAP
jgi:hypothetical protein